MRDFQDELVAFIKDYKLSSVVILSSTMNPVRRERESNRQIPRVFGYANNFLFKKNDRKFYEKYQIQKFGYWLANDKKKGHQELDELAFSGMSRSFMRCFNRQDIEASLFVIFCPGGVDFVGGYSYYRFIKDNLN